MRSLKLVQLLRKTVIEENLATYQNLLSTTKEAHDPVWKGILPIYNNLNEDQKEAFIKFLRIVEVNTLSHVLGILDGTSSYAEINENLILISDQNDEKINGDLQDIFLELEGY